MRRSYASQLKETEALFNSYEHLQGLPRGDSALTMLRKVASLVKPIMRKRGWKVQILAEFLPPEQNLLGLNINKGYKICIRLRYHNNPDLFLPLEQVVDTMLHELSHNVWGDHDSNFHRLWDELRDEHETLVRRGYTGEGFLSEGHRLGGGRYGAPPPDEMRRLARASAEKRQKQSTLNRGSGQRLGGTPLHLYGDVRSVIADQVTHRNTINKGCASGRGDAGKLADQSGRTTFKTKAEEDDANDRAIAQALFDLMEQEEEKKLKGAFSAAPSDGGLAWSPEGGLYDPNKEDWRPSPVEDRKGEVSEEEQLEWAMKASMSHAQMPSTGSAFGSSPISPLTPPGIDRTISAPPPHTQPHPRPGPSRHPPHSRANNKPISRVVEEADDQMAAKRPRGDQSKTKQPAPARATEPEIIDLSEPFNPDEWTCDICTCINPMQFLACDACGTERPAGTKEVAQRPRSAADAPRWTMPKDKQKESLGWNCERCGAFMEHKWWTCSSCGMMKAAS